MAKNHLMTVAELIAVLEELPGHLNIGGLSERRSNYGHVIAVEPHDDHVTLWIDN